MILLTVALFGMKKGAIAGAIGGGLSDFIGGYFYWVVPTLLIKCMWAIVMGLIMHKVLKDKKRIFPDRCHCRWCASHHCVHTGKSCAVWWKNRYYRDSGTGIPDRRRYRDRICDLHAFEKIRCSRSSVRYGQIRIRKNVIK